MKIKVTVKFHKTLRPIFILLECIFMPPISFIPRRIYSSTCYIKYQVIFATYNMIQVYLNESKNSYQYCQRRA